MNRTTHFTLTQTWDAEVFASPINRTEYERKLQKEETDRPGSLGIAISETIEDTVMTPNTKCSLGSVLNHACLHQTVIGQETIKQMELAGEETDVIVGGGGSNCAGIAFPYVRKKITEDKKQRIIAMEPSSCASMTKGELCYDFGDTAQMTTLLWMYTLGHATQIPSEHPRFVISTGTSLSFETYVTK